MKVSEKAKAFCEEFSDNVICDRTRHSIIVNIDPQHLRVVKKEMAKMKYNIVFSKYFKVVNTITICFQQHALSS